MGHSGLCEWSVCLCGGWLPGHAPNWGCGNRSTDAISLHSLYWLLLLLRPWCSGYTGAILAESLSLFQGDICLENIPVLWKYLDNLSAVLATAVTQSNDCSDSSWASFSALPVWFLPQLLHLASCAGYFLLTIFFYLLSSSGDYFFPFYLSSCTNISASPFFPSFHPKTTSWSSTPSILWLWIGVHLLST